MSERTHTFGERQQTNAVGERRSQGAKFGKWEERENVATSVEISSRRVWRGKCREIVQISGRGLSDPGMCVRPTEGEWICGEAGSVGEGEVEISGVFVNADVHIAELPHIFLRESVFP